MTIDVISLTGGQFSLLTSEQIDKVRSAQQKKDELEAKEAEEKRKLKYAAVRAGNYRSAAYEKAVEEIGAKYEEKIGVVREGLLFYLQYSARAEETGGIRRLFAVADRSRDRRKDVLRNEIQYGESAFRRVQSGYNRARLSGRILRGRVRLFCKFVIFA